MGLFSLGGGGGRHVGGMSPIQMGVLGLLAYKALKDKGGLGSILGSGQAPANTSASGTPASGGTLGGILGGGALGGGVLGNGLKDLLDRFRQNGHEDKAQSWVSTGSNKPIAPHELEQTLGEERIQWLMGQTGLPREQLLAGLSNELPHTIDQLTPDGHVPSEEELSRRPS
jgi:uncharacterized protein YidB (DUF937 family)